MRFSRAAICAVVGIYNITQYQTSKLPSDVIKPALKASQ